MWYHRCDAGLSLSAYVMKISPIDAQFDVSSEIGDSGQKMENCLGLVSRVTSLIYGQKMYNFAY